ncbi:MAG: hypothetical protein CL933_26395 [Deltaproteobacteria bacterium]|nr:hypothetical protein [Deltaproteobacteria bacterium]
MVWLLYTEEFPRVAVVFDTCRAFDLRERTTAEVIASFMAAGVQGASGSFCFIPRLGLGRGVRDG